ncbi:MAG: sulfite exporter TauE/SafE family protein [Anaerolineales bacterium]|nr:sulfite exporter TauE/SafE family protein [Anaerolineales bacterium]
MQQYLLAFITGLTTGGLSCLAVQGGLLASSLERQIEQDLVTLHARRSVKQKKRARPELALPILLFLIAKLATYTVLGFLLGALGSVLQLTPVTRAVLLIAIGIFMVGNALRMFAVHPIFRFFTVEPPKFITRYIRRTARNKENIFAPLFLGALTVLIPCGVTQAMMAVAVGTGDPLQGAMLMFAFTLGTTPIFFLVAYLTMQIGARLEKWFLRFVAVVVLVLGLVSINSGLNLAGSPLAFPAVSPETRAVGAQPAGATSVSDGILVLSAENYGYSPRILHAPAGVPLTLTVVTDQTYSCARAFVIPVLRVEVLLPETGTVPIEIPAQAAGTVMQFTCSMGMYTGAIVFDQ